MYMAEEESCIIPVVEKRCAIVVLEAAIFNRRQCLLDLLKACFDDND